MTDLEALQEQVEVYAEALHEKSRTIEQQAALIEANRVERVQLHDRIDILDARIAELAKDAERLSWLIVNIRRYRLYESKGHWFYIPVTAQDWQEGHKSARDAIDAALAASEPKNTGN